FLFVFFQALRIGVGADLLAAEDGDEEVVALETGKIGRDNIFVDLREELLLRGHGEIRLQNQRRVDRVLRVMQVELADAVVLLPDQVDLGRAGADQPGKPEPTVHRESLPRAGGRPGATAVSTAPE